MNAKFRTPAVTVVMPVYNAAATLDAAIASVMAQTFADFELLLLDDGSTDSSLQRLLLRSIGDPRIRLISGPNMGVSRTRNLGADVAAGTLLAFIDADDLWHPKKLQAHVDLHQQQPHLAASYARIAFIAADAAGLAGARTTSGRPGGPLQLIEVLGENPVCTMSNLVVRRDCYQAAGGCDPELSHAEDQALVAQLIADGGSIAGLDQLLVGYRFSPDGLSMDFDRMRAGWQRVASRHLDDATQAQMEALYCRYLARRALRSGGSPRQPLDFALAGLRLDAGSFLRDRRRGLSTLAGALAAPLMTAPLRRRLFA
jgi:glycosyltransferase involved in cell wall biosynthesis